ncbi:MAG: FAD-dependent oxidoreductase [Methylocystaceae bacterium]
MDKETLMQVGNCAICPNMCRFDCPVTNTEHREGVSPAGKMRLAYMLDQGMLEPSPASAANLYQCLGCHGCETWCPFPGLSVAGLLAEARIRYSGMGLAPDAVYQVKQQMDTAKSLYQREQMLNPPVSFTPGAEVLLFAGCAYRRHRPQAVNAAINLLQAAGVEVTMLAEETCCGYPAGCLGLMDTTGRLAAYTQNQLQQSGTKMVVTLCPECFSAFNKRYPAAGIELGMPVQHFVPYVIELWQQGRLPGLKPFNAAVIWHDPCVLGRGLSLYEEPRELLNKIPGIQLLEARYNREQAHCCGAGQLYDVMHPETAGRIAAERVRELEAGAADLIVTGCPFCEHQLGTSGQQPVADLAEVLWASIEGRDGQDFLLQQRVDQVLKKESMLTGKLISAQADRGLVKLVGQVDSWQQVVKAGLLAGAASGVESVVNEICCPDSLTIPAFGPSVASSDVIDEADIIIIGAGVVGCAIARELSRYKLKVVVLEKDSDVGTGTSKANNGMIHPGIFVETGSLKAQLNVRGVLLYQQTAAELNFPLRWCGLLGIVTRPEESFLLEIIKAQAENNGVNNVEILSRDQVLAREPNITQRVLGGFWAPDAGMTSPYKVTVAYAENAVQNGAKFYFDTPVTGMTVEGGAVTGVITPQGRFIGRRVINAAGIYADLVAAMAGEPEFTLHPRRGELVLFDQKQKHLFNSCLAEVTLNIDPHTKGGGLMMTVDGNIEIGPTAEEVPDRENVATTRTGMNKIITKFSNLVDSFNSKEVIAYFSGLRAATYTEDFHIRPSRLVRGLFNVAGIQSPGLAAAPAIAEYVLEMLQLDGMSLRSKTEFNPICPAMHHFKDLSREEQNQLVHSDHRFGLVVCRCETVTEGEIVEAIHRPIPALNLDAIKRRTRAGMGRCQGGFCTPRVAAILARETGQPLDAITKNGQGSWLFVAREGGC